MNPPFLIIPMAGEKMRPQTPFSPLIGMEGSGEWIVHCLEKGGNFLQESDYKKRLWRARQHTAWVAKEATKVLGNVLLNLAILPPVCLLNCFFEGDR